MNFCYPFVHTPLPYSYDALEPYIDEKTMHLHYDRHLQNYINQLNELLKQNPSLQKLPICRLICCAHKLSEPLKTSVRNQAGGVYNHLFYFDGMIAPSSQPWMPIGRLAKEIDRQFGSFAAFKKRFQKAALSVFGSGYAWLILCQNQLRIVTTPNQNTPIGRGACPILNIDVWEHAYYLKHYNERAAYIDDWFSVVNWEKADERYLAARQSCRR